MNAAELRDDREMVAAANGDLLPDPAPLPPARRQIYAIAKLLLDREGLRWPRSRVEAAELITRLRREGQAAARSPGRRGTSMGDAAVRRRVQLSAPVR